MSAAVSMLAILHWLLIVLSSAQLTEIDRIWYDDFEYQIDHWSSDPADPSITGSQVLYHGPYNGDQNDTITETTLSRPFECVHMPLAVITYTMVYCGIEDKKDDFVDLYVNDERIVNFRAPYETYNDTAFLDTAVLSQSQADCDANFGDSHKNVFQYHEVGPVESLVGINTVFTFRIEESISNRDDIWYITDIVIECKDTESPSISPSNNPEDANSGLGNELLLIVGIVSGVLAVFIIYGIVRCGITIRNRAALLKSQEEGTGDRELDQTDIDKHVVTPKAADCEGLKLTIEGNGDVGVPVHPVVEQGEKDIAICGSESPYL